jgi:hypothetical protein
MRYRRVLAGPDAVPAGVRVRDDNRPIERRVEGPQGFRRDARIPAQLCGQRLEHRDAVLGTCERLGLIRLTDCAGDDLPGRGGVILKLGDRTGRVADRRHPPPKQDEADDQARPSRRPSGGARTRGLHRHERSRR